MPKVKALPNILGKPKATPTKKNKNQPPPEDLEVYQEQLGNAEGDRGDYKVVPSTISYASLDSTDEEAMRISKYEK